MKNKKKVCMFNTYRPNNSLLEKKLLSRSCLNSSRISRSNLNSGRISRSNLSSWLFYNCSILCLSDSVV